MTIKLSQVDVSTGINNQNTQEIETALKDSGLSDDKIEEIKNILSQTPNTQTAPQTNPQSNPQENTPSNTSPGTKNVLQPGKQLANEKVSADELLRRIDKSNRLMLCAEDLRHFEEEVKRAAKFLAEEVDIDFEDALYMAEEELYNEIKGEE